MWLLHPGTGVRGRKGYPPAPWGRLLLLLLPLRRLLLRPTKLLPRLLLPPLAFAMRRRVLLLPLPALAKFGRGTTAAAALRHGQAAPAAVGVLQLPVLREVRSVAAKSRQSGRRVGRGVGTVRRWRRLSGDPAVVLYGSGLVVGLIVVIISVMRLMLS